MVGQREATIASVKAGARVPEEKRHTLSMPAVHLKTQKNGLVKWCKKTIKALEKETGGLENYWIEIKIHKHKEKPQETTDGQATA